jgi:hypothetical protein
VPLWSARFQGNGPRRGKQVSPTARILNTTPPVCCYNAGRARCAALAQLVRALDCGSRGPPFNPGRRYHSTGQFCILREIAPAELSSGALITVINVEYWARRFAGGCAVLTIAARKSFALMGFSQSQPPGGFRWFAAIAPSRACPACSSVRHCPAACCTIAELWNTCFTIAAWTSGPSASLSRATRTGAAKLLPSVGICSIV